MGIDIVSYAMGAAGKAKIISAADWESMTDEEKAKYGVVALNTADSGYFRGYLVDGKSLSRSLLDMSDAPFISLEEFWDTFVEGDETWGQFTANGSVITRDEDGECILLENNTYLTAEVLGEKNFTVYCVCLRPTTSNNFRPFFSLRRNNTQHMSIGTYGTGSQFKPTNNNTYNLSTICTDWHVFAVSADVQNGTYNVYVDNTYYNSLAFADYVFHGVLSVGANDDGTEWRKIALKYCAVTQKADSKEIVDKNIQKIMQYFGLGEV